MLKQRLDSLQTGRGQARNALERVEVFAHEMRARLREGEVPFRKAYIRAVIDSVELASNETRLAGLRDVLDKAVAKGPDAPTGVRSSERKWRTRHDSNV